MNTIGRAILKVANSWRAVLALYLGSILVAAIIFSLAEPGRSLWDGIWWAFITGLTIGYGDVYPTTAIGRAVGIVLAHIVILGIAPMIISIMTLRLVVDNDAFTDAEQKAMQSTLAALQADVSLLREHFGVERPPQA